MSTGESSTSLRTAGSSLAERLQSFADACGMPGTMRLNVRNLETGEVTKHDFATPFVLVGRDPACQIVLPNPDVSARHAYLQVIDGRLHCFDVGSRTGMRLNDVLLTEGILNARDSLLVGPYQVQLSQAPAYWTPEANGEMPQFDNSVVDGELLKFGNARGRSRKDPVKRLRRKLTLLGRNKQCHIKLSHDSVGRIHAVVVRTRMGKWFVNLRQDRATLVNDRPLAGPCAPLGESDRITLGRFKMTLTHNAESGALRPDDSTTNLKGRSFASVPEMFDDEQMGRADELQRDEIAEGYRTHPGGAIEAASREAASRSIDPTVMALINEFGRMHRQVLEQTHQQNLMMAQVMGAIQQSQDATIHQQLAQIQAITEELNVLRRPRIEHSDAEAASDGRAVSPQPDTGPTIDAEHEPKREDQVAPVAPPPPQSTPNAAGSDLSGAADRESPQEVSQEAVFASASQEEDWEEEIPETASDRAARNPAEMYRDITFRINELERQRSSSWQRIMSLLGKQDSVN